MSIMDQVKARLKEQIRESVAKAVELPIGEIPDVVIEVPKDRTHGDFATNIAMQLTRAAKRNPRQIAEAIVAGLDRDKAGVVGVEIAGPGFINFTMNKSFLFEVVKQVLEQDDKYGSTHHGQGKKVNVEFVSANPTGNLHLGHARGAAVGDALCRMLSMAGYDVTREYYINDAGNQIFNMARSIDARYREALGMEAEMPEDGYFGEDIIRMAKELTEQEGDRYLQMSEQERLETFREVGLGKELDKIRHDLARFRVEFDVWFSESSLYKDNRIQPVLDKLKANGYIYEQEGATWLRSTDLGDDKDRVLIKNDGTYTYLTPDVAYHEDKMGRGFDQLINIWGADHHGYIPRMKAAMEALGYDRERLTVLISQMVSLYQDGEKVKMSKRTGKAVTMEDLMEEVGLDATRYFFTMRSTDSHLDFDMDLAVSKSNENPVFYVQYAHARIHSIFRQAEEAGVTRRNLDQISLDQLQTELEIEILRKLGELPEEIVIAADQMTPHRVVRYVHELASMFHSYYNAERVLTEDEEKTQARLALLDAIRMVLRNVLGLIGVSAPERM
jgi:arginyl-tRNA synthetase